jgi:hypothetical protein
VWDLDNNATYMAGFSIGFPPFASSLGNSRFLKFSFGLGIAYVDINIDLSLCTEAGGLNSGFCKDKSKIDNTALNSFYPMGNLYCYGL